MSKLFGTDTADAEAHRRVQVLGGYGYVEDFPAERYLREAKILQIVEGTNQVQRVVIGRSLTGRERSVTDLARQRVDASPASAAPCWSETGGELRRPRPRHRGCRPRAVHQRGAPARAAPAPSRYAARSTRRPRDSRSPRRSLKPLGSRPPPTPGGLRHLPAVEACHSVAGDESYILQVRVAGPAELEALLQEIRSVAGLSTRTTVVLSTPWEGRSAPPAG
jgi:Lrp/AsnC family leucine-responsive transcriptional regulator